MKEDMSKLNLVMLKRQVLIKDTAEPVQALTWYPSLEVRRQSLISVQSLTLESSHQTSFSLFVLYLVLITHQQTLGPVLNLTLHKQHTSITGP